MQDDGSVQGVAVGLEGADWGGGSDWVGGEGPVRMGVSGGIGGPSGMGCRGWVGG